MPVNGSAFTAAVATTSSSLLKFVCYDFPSFFFPFVPKKVSLNLNRQGLLEGGVEVRLNPLAPIKSNFRCAVQSYIYSPRCLRLEMIKTS